PHAFYLLGLSTSGLVSAVHAGDTTVYLRSITGIKAGDIVRIGTGNSAERRKVVSVGTAASPSTTLWQPLPDGPVVTIPAGATNVPVTSTADFEVGQKIGLGYGATYPAVGLGLERYEVATVTAVGKPGTQAYLAADAPVGASNIKVTSIANISVGDRIRLDIASVGHGVETVKVKNIGTAATRTNLSANAAAGATTIRVRNAAGLAVGQKIIIGTPANHQAVTITGIDNANPAGTYPTPPPSITFTPALAAAHVTAEWVMEPGTGLELTEPLKFAHSNNLPFSARGTGISFAPASKFPHASNEPVQALGTGVTVDSPLAHAHAIDSVVQDGSVTTAGYQPAPKPNQWFGGPALSASAGSMVLRDASGAVADSLNYGLLVDPWAARGDQATSGTREEGCRVAAPGSDGGFGVQAIVSNRSAGRFPDGADSDSNCKDFQLQPAAILPEGSPAGARTIKVSNVVGFEAGQTVSIGQGTEQETDQIASVGTGGASRTTSPVQAGGTVLPVATTAGFRAGQAITIDAGAGQETATVNAVAGGRAGARIIIAAPLAKAHPTAAEVYGSGITLANTLSHAHANGAQINAAIPTPGAPNKYFRP
ncbi:MAG TPA: hypothetical protein VHZ32_02130, partial [Rhizomicrobium sp.]|nr:hypothetical protein [Rhizomicrobium sp.]